MTHSQAPVKPRPPLFWRRRVRIASAALAVAALTGLATLASCGSSSSGSPMAGSAASSSNIGTGLGSATGIITPPPGSPGGSRGPDSLKSCTISADLVNSCGPWVGAAASGNPGAPDNDVQQFLYLEKLLGHHLAIFRDYHNASGKGVIGNLPLNRTELYFVKQPNTYLDINWKPAGNWAQADGGDATVNATIRKVADSIRSVAPRKIFLTVWVEPQNDVSGGTNCQGLVGHAGTPAQYRQMWANVENIFSAQGVTNVIWTMDYMSYPHFDCLVPQLWPGNNLVDWVLYDTYDHDNTVGTTWANTVGRFYHVLENDSSPSVDFDSKPWGLGEFNTCQNPSSANTQQYFEQGKQAIESNAYPRLKMYNIFATTGGGTASRGCLTNYTPGGQLDLAKNALIRALFSIPIFSQAERV
jgi:hypothetical protein